MAWDRVKSLFTRSTGVATAPRPRGVSETVARPKRGDVPPRFSVERVSDGVTFQGYAGFDGGDARRAWEAYRDSELKGVFTFWDGAESRGEFRRE